MQISDEMIEHLMIAARGIAWDKGVTVSEAEIARQHTRQVLEAALSAAEPVAWQPRYKQEVIDHHKSIGSDLWEYAITVYPTKEQAQGYGYGGHECRALYAAPPAPSVAVKALQMADETFRDLGWHDKYEATTAALTALSAQVQDVAGWQLVPKEPTDEMLKALAGGHSVTEGHYAASQRRVALRQFTAMLAAAPAKQEG